MTDVALRLIIEEASSITTTAFEPPKPKELTHTDSQISGFTGFCAEDDLHKHVGGPELAIAWATGHGGKLNHQQLLDRG